MRRLNLFMAQMAIPLILSNLTVPLLSLTNTIVVGHLDHSYYLAAVGLGGMIFNFMYWALGFLRLGTTGMIAQANGERDFAKMYSLILHCLFIALTIGILFILLQYPIEKLAFLFIGSTDAIRHFTQQYYFIRIWGAPGTLINYVLIGVFIGLQRMRVPMIMMMIVNVSAAMLCVLFVYGFHMAANGVAAADVISQYLGIIIGLILLWKLLKRLDVHYRLSIQTTVLKKLFSVNKDIFIRTLGIIFVFSFFTAQSAKFGANILAANTILLTLAMMVAYAYGGFENVAESLVGQRYGERNYRSMFDIITDSFVWALLVALGFVILYYFVGESLIALMTSIKAVQLVSQHYIIFMILFPILAVWGFLLDGVFVGASWFIAMRNTMFISFIGYMIIWYGFSRFSNSGLWIAFLSFFVLRGITMLAVLLYKRKKLIGILK